LSSARHDAIKAVTNYKSNGQTLNFRETPSATLFASNVLNEKIMKDRLPKSVYKRSITTTAAIWCPRRSISRMTSLGP
jgi:glutamine synthetase type III